MEGTEQPAQHQMEMGEPQDNELFQRANDLRVIQEYNKDENIPKSVIKNYWAPASKSVKLGFWEKDDEPSLYFMNNIIGVGDIMSKPKHKNTFEARQQRLQMNFLLYCDFKRGVGMERYKINERTLQ